MTTSQPVYPHPTVTPILEEPTFATLQTLIAELNTNAMAVPSNRGGGAHGHLTLLVQPANYLLLAGVAFVPPPNPGPVPIHPAAATAAQIAELNRQFTANQLEYRTYLNVEQTLKSMLLQAVLPTFLSILRDPELGFAQVTTIALLTHLRDTYGVIDADALAANELSLEREWSPDDPIEDLWSHILECQRFSTNGGDPISNATAVRAAIKVLTKSGVFNDDLRDWRKRTPVQHTWANVVTDFTRANKERKLTETARKAGFHGANTVQQVDPLPCPHYAGSATMPTQSKNQPVSWYYCWTHGLSRLPEHTSNTCKNPAEGHVCASTVENMQGGNNTIRRLPNERAIHRKPPSNRNQPAPPTAVIKE